jgi:hypothetical protein
MTKKRIAMALVAMAALGGTWSSASADDDGFAPVDSKGTLTLKVKVEGAGRVNSRGPEAGWDYYKWSTINEGTLRYELTAMEPTVDASQFAGLNAATAAAAANAGSDDADEDDDSDWEDAWDEKFDACNEDQACEFRVTQEKMKDPHFKKKRAAASSALAAIQSGDLDFGPAVQMWSATNGVVNGTIAVKEQRDTYGIVSETGGPKDEKHCTTTGKETLTPKPTGYGDMSMPLSVNVKKGTYELVLDANYGLSVTDTCSPGEKNSRTLLGYPPKGVTGWNGATTVKGLTAGKGSQLGITGQKTWEGNLSTAGNEPIKVTISWEFRPVTGR